MSKMVTKVEMITPEKAKSILEKNTINRKLDQRRVSFYSEQMLKGNWVLTHEGIALDKFGRLIDGQHRLSGIVESNVAQNMLVTYNMSEDVITKINKGKSRSITDDFNIKNIKNAKIVSVGIRDFLKMEKLNKGVIDSKLNYSKNTYSADEVMDRYNSDWSFFDEIATLSMHYYNKNNFRLFSYSDYFAIICYLVKTKKHSLEKVKQFFDELNTHSEIEVLNIVRNKILTEGNKRRLSKQHVMTKYYKHSMLVTAWNNFIKGTNPPTLIVKENVDYI